MSSVPFRDRAIRLYVVRFSQVKKQTLVFRRNGFVAPVARLCFATNVASKNSERVTMIAIAGNYLPNCVAAGEEDRYKERGCEPKVGTPQRGFPTSWEPCYSQPSSREATQLGG